MSLAFNLFQVEPDNPMLQRALATLFSYQKKYDKAMAMYLKLGHKDVFQLIRRYSHAPLNDNLSITLSNTT